jgi:hypothetical protein
MKKPASRQSLFNNKAALAREHKSRSFFGQREPAAPKAQEVTPHDRLDR